MTTEELKLVREYGKWLAKKDRVRRLRDLLNAAWKAKAPNGAIGSPEGDENAAKVARQFFCSWVEQFGTELERGQVHSGE